MVESRKTKRKRRRKKHDKSRAPASDIAPRLLSLCVRVSVCLCISKKKKVNKKKKKLKKCVLFGEREGEMRKKKTVQQQPELLGTYVIDYINWTVYEPACGCCQKTAAYIIYILYSFVVCVVVVVVVVVK